MKNKYQESLNVVNNFFEWNSTEGLEVKYPFKYDYELVSKSVDTLQELIDKYSKDSCEYPYHIVDEIREQLNVTERLTEKLAKALDKACELLTCLDCHDCERVCHIKCDDVRKSEFSCTKEDWKEWLLKDGK